MSVIIVILVCQISKMKLVTQHISAAKEKRLLGIFESLHENQLSTKGLKKISCKQVIGVHCVHFQSFFFLFWNFFLTKRRFCFSMCIALKTMASTLLFFSAGVIHTFILFTTDKFYIFSFSVALLFLEPFSTEKYPVASPCSLCKVMIQ